MLTQALENTAKQAFASMAPEQAQSIKKAISELQSAQIKQSALKVGECIKSFSLLNIYEEPVRLEELFKGEYLLLNFYRGGWCPFCVLELQAYEGLKEQFAQHGVDIVAISPEVAKYAKESKQEHNLSFEVLCDEDAKLMKSFGIVFSLSPEVKELYNTFGIDLSEQNANEHFELPVPATYVLNKALEVVYAHVEEDYTTRAEPAKVLEAIKALG